MPAPAVVAAGISALGGLAGGLFGSSQANKDRAQRAYEFAQQMGLANKQFGLDKDRFGFDQRVKNREWNVAVEDRQRRLMDNNALNPNRQAIMQLLMQRFMGNGGGAAAPAPAPAPVNLAPKPTAGLPFASSGVPL